MERARAIYEWIVENTYRDPKVLGCGVGDIRFMLESRNLGGKCGDLNALFVGLRAPPACRRATCTAFASPTPSWAKESLGKSGETSKRSTAAPSSSAGFGWMPVDPADVRKVMLEEGEGLPLNDPGRVALRASGCSVRGK